MTHGGRGVPRGGVEYELWQRFNGWDRVTVSATIEIASRTRHVCFLVRRFTRSRGVTVAADVTHRPIGRPHGGDLVVVQPPFRVVFKRPILARNNPHFVTGDDAGVAGCMCRGCQCGTVVHNNRRFFGGPFDGAFCGSFHVSNTPSDNFRLSMSDTIDIHMVSHFDPYLANV